MDDEEVAQCFLRHTFATTCQQSVRPDIVDIYHFPLCKINLTSLHQSRKIPKSYLQGFFLFFSHTDTPFVSLTFF